MINYFVVRGKERTLRAFLHSWPNPAAELFQVVPYDSLPLIRGARPGVFLFSDIDRLRPEEVREVERLGDLLRERMDPSVVLNHPRGLRLRLELLRSLHADGANRFRAFPAEAPPGDIRFPVFLRRENDHAGPLTDLLSDPGEYRQALARLESEGAAAAGLIGIEFCDARSPDGLYRKYAAFRVGDEIIPGHVLFSRHWMAKDSGPDPARDEERDYLTRNPHREELLRIFDRAGIDYGRIDYALLDGAIQVWEINTNPMLIQEREKYSVDKLPLKQRLVDQLAEAFLALHRMVDPVRGKRVPIPNTSRAWLRRAVFGFDV